MGDNPSKTKDDAMNETAAHASKAFATGLDELMINAAEKSQNKIEVIYLDKNHPPRALVVTNQIDEMSKKYNEVKFIKVALVPHIVNPYVDSPFSLTFLLSCLIRNIRRDTHDTLTNEDPLLLVSVELLFFNLYNNMKFDQKFLEEHKFDGFLKIPFTYEDEDIELPKNMELALIDAKEKRWD